MRVGIATCEPTPVPDLEAGLVAIALERAGHEGVLAPWSDPGVDWSSFDVVWISSTWDYHERLDEFTEWLARTGVVTELHNPRVLVEWNIDKRYLRELGGAEVAIVPTVWAQPELAASAQETVGDLGWEQVIVKPTVDLGASNLELVAPDDVAAAVERAGRPALVQPYLPSLADEGELSLVYLRGQLSHVVRKRAAHGDFRIQEQYGGVYTLTEATEDALQLGAGTLAALDGISPAVGAPLYARVDLVRDLEGELCVIELELIEPSLYLDVAGPEAVTRFAGLLAAAAD
jgi:hypothetical protein